MIVNEGNLIYITKSFSNKEEGQRYFEAQPSKSKLMLSETFGDTFNVIKSVSSLSESVVFCLAYESYTSIDDCVILVSEMIDRWVVAVEEELFYVQPSRTSLLGSCQLSTPLSALYLWKRQLLVIEEAGLKVTNMNGVTERIVNTDLIKDIRLTQSELIITTIEGEQMTINLKE